MIRFICEAPTAEEYNGLRKSVGWPVFDTDSVRNAIEATSFFAIARDGEEIIAMGRVTGDGCLSFYISDVIVKPEYQRRGMGRRIMEELLSYVETHAVNNSHIGLNSALGKEEFYKKFGFGVRPNEKWGPGMSLFWRK